MSTLAAHLGRIGRYLLLAGLLLLLACSALLWFVTTDTFQQLVRGRLVAAVERATGGRAELGSFHVIPLRLQVEVRNLTIHGREAAAEAPYVHVDSVTATLNLSAALGAKIGFHSLVLQHPVVHIIFYPDGSTNQPTPKQQSADDFEKILAFSVRRLEVHDGELLWQDRSLPLDFAANDVAAAMNYSFLHRRYSGRLEIGKAETQFNGYRPVGWAGQAVFVLDRNGVQIGSLKATSEGSRLQASGTVTNFSNPIFKGTYDLLLDLTQAGSVTRRPQLKAGKLSLNGSGSWSSQTFSSAGVFSLRDLDLRDKTLATRDVSASGNYFIDPQKIQISKVEGKLLYGTFSSDAEVSGWQTAQRRPRNSKGEQQRGVVKIRVKGISLSEALATLGPPFHPMNRLRFAGNLSGSSEIKWTGSIRNAQASFTAAVERPAKLLPGQVPLSGSADGTYNALTVELQLHSLQAFTPATQVRASGALTASSTLRLSFASTDFGEWRPVISEMFPTGVPFNIEGRASFNGSASGKPSSVTLAGNLQVEDFGTQLSKAAEPVHWDSLAADIRASARSLTLHNAVLQHGDASVSLDGNVGLVDWKPVPGSPLNLNIEVHNADAAEFARSAGYNYNLTGILDATASLSGSIARPQGHAKVILSHSSFQGYAFDGASASLNINSSQVGFQDLHLARGDERVTGSGAYDLTARSFQLSLNGTNFDLTEFSPLEQSRIAIAGRLDFSLHAFGTTSEPQVNADLRLRGLAFNGEVLGDYILNATSRGPNMKVAGHSEFQNADLRVDGNVQLHDDWPAHLDLSFQRLDVDSFVESYLRGHVTGHSSVAGALQLDGPLRRPEQLNVAGSLSEVSAEIQKIKLHNEGPIRFSVANRTLKIETLHVLGGGTDFSATGSMQFADGRALDFQGQGKLDLSLIHTYDPDITSSGTLSGQATVTGTLDAPLVKGKLQMHNGAISDVALPNALTDLNGTLIFSQNRITIQTLTARTGGGTVNFTGHADLIGRQFNFDVAGEVDAVRLRYPPGVSSTANADLHWRGSSSGSLLSGDITVIKLGVTPGFDFGTYLERSAQSAGLPTTDPVLNNIRLDLHVVTTPELQMQTSVLRLQGEADLRVRGNAAKPVLLGRADVFEGEAYFNGTKYQLERGAVTFGATVGTPGSTTPFLDLEATTRVRDYDITLSMSGPADKPKLNYRSEPPLPTSDIIGLLAFGQTTEQSASLQQANQSAFSQQASSAMLAAALNATLNNRTQRLFGGSRIKIDPQGLVTETAPTQSGPAVTIEQQVKDNLTVTYTTNVAQTSQQIIRAEYNVTRNISVVAIRDQNGVVSFDVKIRRRKR